MVDHQRSLLSTLFGMVNDHGHCLFLFIHHCLSTRMKKNTVKYILFTLALSWYLWHVTHRIQGIYRLGFVANYLADLLCVPIIASLTLAVIRYTHRVKQLTLLQVLGIATYISIIFEAWLPKKYPNTYTADYWDILCYFIGAVVFYLLQKW